MRRYSKQQLFDEWVALEQADSKWLEKLPACPNAICIDEKGKPIDCDNGQWESIGEANQNYHKNAKWCMRSKSKFLESGQQCCYDEEGKLITSGLGAGTPDRYAPALINAFFLLHFLHDVVPFFIALKLDKDKEGNPNLGAYLSVRPPSKGGGNCYKLCHFVIHSSC